MTQLIHLNKKSLCLDIKDMKMMVIFIQWHSCIGYWHQQRFEDCLHFKTRNLSTTEKLTSFPFSKRDNLKKKKYLVINDMNLENSFIGLNIVTYSLLILYLCFAAEQFWENTRWHIKSISYQKTNSNYQVAKFVEVPSPSPYTHSSFRIETEQPCHKCNYQNKYNTFAILSLRTFKLRWVI